MNGLFHILTLFFQAVEMSGFNKFLKLVLGFTRSVYVNVLFYVYKTVNVSKKQLKSFLSRLIYNRSKLDFVQVQDKNCDFSGVLMKIKNVFKGLLV